MKAEVVFVGSGIPGPRTKDYTKHAEPRPAQPGNPVYKVKSYPNTTATEPENVEPLNGKQQRGVLDVDGPASPVRLPLMHACAAQPGTVLPHGMRGERQEAQRPLPQCPVQELQHPGQ